MSDLSLKDTEKTDDLDAWIASAKELTTAKAINYCLAKLGETETTNRDKSAKLRQLLEALEAKG